ncbi:MAG: SusC/RagA family TonB-linked outer membrane protein, partial [Candidatus Cryptobacteroides sp.]
MSNRFCKGSLLTLLSALVILAGPLTASAQTVTAKGTVVDAATGEPLIGAVVLVKAKSVTDHVITDIDGRFSVNAPSGSTLEISLMGYKTLEVKAAASLGRIALAADVQLLDEVQVIAYGKQSKMSVTGAITSINTEELLKSPSGSAASALAGAVTGISTVQTSGQPGSDDPQIFVRGAGSLTSEASSPLILVDGVERSFFQMDPNEIESITVLKDASSTAVFGVRGANGVILVTTRRGAEEKMNISVSSQFGLTQALRKLTCVDSYTYATLYTEAQKSDGVSDSNLIFSDYVIERFKKGDDPIMFPNVDWQKEIFKNFSWQTQHNVTMSGGGKRFRYFVSLGYMHQDGVLKQNYETYNSNFRYDRFNYRTNVDVNLTKTTLLKLNIGGRLGSQKQPNNEDLWRTVMWCVPFSSPGFVDGKLIQNGANPYIPIGETKSPYDYYYNWGYYTTNQNVLNLDLAVEQNLDCVTKGLSISVKGAYNTTHSVTVLRAPSGTDSTYIPIYQGSITQPGMSISDPRFDNTIIYRTEGVSGLNEPLTYSETSSSRARDWYLEGAVNYSRTFGDHAVTGLFLYNQSKKYYPSSYTDIPTGYVGYVWRATYSYKQKYMLDLNAGYNGSENFAPGKRYGFFPSASAGWVISSEPWMRKAKVVDFLKIRASYGVVGNDKYSGERFLYLGGWNGNHSAVSDGSYGSWQFGTDPTTGMLRDAVESRQGNEDVTWEKAYKQNYGVDLRMFDNRLNFTGDVFYEHRKDILSKRKTSPSVTDYQLPLMNLGIVDNWGYELSLGWKDTRSTHKVGYWITANMSYSKNKIIFMDEVTPNEPYMAQTGRSTGLNYGLIFDRFYRPSDFDENGELLKDADGKYLLPEQSGDNKPGDPLFKDLNHDGKIDGDDCTYFGYGSRPDYVFGLVAGLSWKGLSVSMQWTGALHASRVLSGEYRTPFGTQNSRSLLTYLADGRWT